MYVDGRIEILSDFFFDTHKRSEREREREKERIKFQVLSFILFSSMHACSVLSRCSDEFDDEMYAYFSDAANGKKEEEEKSCYLWF